MAVPRIVPSLAVAALAVALLAWGWSVAQPVPGQAGSYEVRVVGPSGLFWSGNVTVGDGATVLDALQAAADAGGFAVEVERQAYGDYVRAIGPYRETSTGGWNFCIDAGDGFRWVPVGASVRGLQPGERVEWRWAEDGSEVC